MSNILMIRHLPESLSFQDKEILLKHFGADKVWETKSRRNFIFASFVNEDQAKRSLLKLHQLEIARRRLVVEYAKENQPVSNQTKINSDNNETSNHIQEFLRTLNGWNPSVNFYQPPSPNLKYKYPDPSPSIFVNMIHALKSHTPLYTQTLHLMNKMCLENPFEKNEKAEQYFKETFREYFLQDIPKETISESESEISSEEVDKQVNILPKVLKRKHTLPKTRKRPKAILNTAGIPASKKKALVQEEVFEGAPIVEQKKISLIVNQDMLQKPTEEPVVVGELGKFEKKTIEEITIETPEETEKPTITRRELQRNRISYSEMKVLPVFKNYHPGPPSMRLYIKNLAKNVLEEDVKCIYRRYIEHLSEEEQIGFDVRVMQEGRMKGQAFVTFPAVKLAEKALNETNGYLLNDKPMVVQFARAANKKNIQ